MNRPAQPSDRMIDLGERRITEELVLARLRRSRFPSAHLGEDAGIYDPRLELGEIELISTDPCPTPVVFELLDRDYWHYGRMTAVIGLSDIAAMGGRPHGLSVSTIMSPSMAVADFSRFMDGLCETCDEYATPVLGGNIREGRDFQVTCTAVGAARRDRLRGRAGLRPSDRICVIGDMGAFWSGVLSATHLGSNLHSLNDYLRRALIRPQPRLREGALVAGSGLASVCMDASDGVGACLATFALANDMKIVLDSDVAAVPPEVVDVADALSIDPLKLLLSWGNWELVLGVAEQSLPALAEHLAEHDVRLHEIGYCTHGSGVWLHRQGDFLPLTYFGSDRFTKESYMSTGAMAYAEWLISTPLVSSS